MTRHALTAREGLHSAVGAALQAHLDRQRALLGRLGPDSLELVDEVDSMLSGGKRLRAAFCYWSWRAHGGTPDSPQADSLARVGAALELFQAAALFHDDVMDDSDTRRGKPAAHRTFAARHRSAGWTGNADRYGSSAAILLGDLCLIASEEEFAAAMDEQAIAVSRAARAVFDLMRTEVTVGQFLDVRAQAQPLGLDPQADLDRAREVIRAKSARYSVEHPLVLGATLAGAGAEQVAATRRFGLPLGEAFQLRDDLLGVYGDPSATGKPAGDDLREGKRTVLVSLALLAADDAQRAVILDGLGRADLTVHDVGRLREAIARTGAVAAVEHLIAELSAQGFDALRVADLHQPAADVLVELGRAAVQRTA